MSRKKAFNIILCAFMLMGINVVPSKAQDLGKNGVSYVLLNDNFVPNDGPGVYRFNDSSGNAILPPYSTTHKPFRVFMNLSSAQGLSADQSKNTILYLMKPSDSSATDPNAGWTNADVGYLPTGISFDPDSEMYLKVALPSDVDNYDYPASAHGWGSYFQKDYTIGSTKYSRAVVFGGPTGVRLLHGGLKSGDYTTGTPLWNGSGHLPHPTDSHKIILPSHYCAVSYYLYGTSNSPYNGEKMDGKEGRPEYTYDLANDMGAYNTDLTKHNNETYSGSWYQVTTNTPADGHRCGADQFFGCVVKRIYQLKEKTLDMYKGTDTTNTLGSNMSATNMSVETTGVLATNDFRVKEFYGKTCGDNCIPGVPLPDKDVAGFLSSINVLSTTTGRRYGYNKEGNPAGGGVSAALRVIRPSGSSFVTSDVRIDGSYLNTNITNGSKFGSASEIKNIGVSSRFTSGGSALDYIYGSSADKFVVQDSWWGLGGIAYEYDITTKQVTKYDYMKNPNASGNVVGTINGIVDSIGIDGDAYLYALKTEVGPDESIMKNIGSYLGTNPSGSDLTISGYNLPVTLSGWKRNVPKEDDSSSYDVVDVAPSNVQPDDYREVTVKQRVKKVLVRYPDATNAMGTEEARGEIFAGYDTWKNSIKRVSGTGSSGTNTWTKSVFEVEPGSRASSIQAELAVVNVADHPTYIEGTTNHYLSASKLDGSKVQSGAVINEHGSFVFKVEGYKPFGWTFKNVGSFNANGVNLTNVKLNSIQNTDGGHEFDENSDGNKSGYPSNMFEADGKLTKVLWSIWQVENTSAADYKSNPKIIKTILSNKQVTSAENSECKLTHQFKDPGKYIVKAEIQYNCFTYDSFTTAGRPDQLSVTTGSNYTEPMMVLVAANDLNLNQTTSYITNISLTKNNKKSLPRAGVLDQPNPSSIDSGSDFDTAEGKEYPSQFGDLTLTFDAQFFRVENENNLSNYKTYDGIGVWDYNYYKELYKNAKKGIVDSDGTPIPGRGLDLATPTVNPSYQHVYNVVSGINSKDRRDLDNVFNINKHNPGFAKETSDPSGYDYRAGTEVYGDPNDYDKSFIQWFLYLRPILPQDLTAPVDTMVTRGSVIASGTCKGVAFTPLGNRKYRASITIGDVYSKISTPRDPSSYTVDLEIVYPRVTWLNNSLGSSDSNKYYSSIVPIGPDASNPSVEMSPIHVLSNLNMVSVSGDKSINQSFYDGTVSTSNIFSNPPSVTLCVRDTTVASLTVDESYIKTNYETTGDKVLTMSTFRYEVKDNNPFMQFCTDSTTVPSTIVPLSNSNPVSINSAKNGIKLYFEKLKTGTDLNYVHRNTDFNPLEGTKSVEIKFNNTESFYEDDNWYIMASYTEDVTGLSPFTNPAVLGNAAAYEFGNTTSGGDTVTGLKNRNIDVDGNIENWVGTLSYKIQDCYIYDGFGKDGSKEIHELCKPEDKTLPGIVYLERIDNDPPSIKVDLISQSDNRRWEYQLIEGVNDKVRCPRDKKDLAPSKLIVRSYELVSANGNPSNSVLVNKTALASGSTNVYPDVDEGEPKAHDNIHAVGNPTVKVSELVSDTATFRTSARLIVNVDILDNCGFKALDQAEIKINGTSYGDVLPTVKLNTEASHDEHGNIIADKFQNKPRGTFAVDLPTTVKDGNIEITVTAKDVAGNAKELVIPFTMIGTSFDARVIESKENRIQNLGH